jgi:hypothetical protein
MAHMKPKKPKVVKAEAIGARIWELTIKPIAVKDETANKRPIIAQKRSLKPPTPIRIKRR